MHYDGVERMINSLGFPATATLKPRFSFDLIPAEKLHIFATTIAFRFYNAKPYFLKPKTLQIIDSISRIKREILRDSCECYCVEIVIYISDSLKHSNRLQIRIDSELTQDASNLIFDVKGGDLNFKISLAECDREALFYRSLLSIKEDKVVIVASAIFERIMERFEVNSVDYEAYWTWLGARISKKLMKAFQFPSVLLNQGKEFIVVSDYALNAQKPLAHGYWFNNVFKEYLMNHRTSFPNSWDYTVKVKIIRRESIEDGLFEFEISDKTFYKKTFTINELMKNW